MFDKLGPVGRGRCSDVSLDVNLATGHIDRGCHRLNRATFEYNTASHAGIAFAFTGQFANKTQ